MCAGWTYNNSARWCCIDAVPSQPHWLQDRWTLHDQSKGKCAHSCGVLWKFYTRVAGTDKFTEVSVFPAAYAISLKLVCLSVWDSQVSRTRLLGKTLGETGTLYQPLSAAATTTLSNESFERTGATAAAVDYDNVWPKLFFQRVHTQSLPIFLKEITVNRSHSTDNGNLLDASI